MFLNLKIIIVLMVGMVLSNTMDAQKKAYISLGTGFGYENKIIETLETDYFYLQNREIIYVKAVEFKVGLKLDSHVNFGADISYTWATLDWLGQYGVLGSAISNIGLTINNIGWTSVGGWGKYILLPHKRLQFAIVASTGAHFGYPKRMNVDTIERKVAFYAGLHGGPQYKISDKFMASYYYGRGKFRNMILLTYSL
jgi:hypothetical protein